MDLQSAREVRASLPEGGTVFRYFKDRYALQLLTYAAAEWRSLPDIRRGRFAPLVQKPAIRKAIADWRRGTAWELLDTYFPAPTEPYEVTLGLWGSLRDWRWNQTTRPGFNVVVQLNFPRAHERAYLRYVRPNGRPPFVRTGHPVRRRGLHTLAWARLDIDPHCGEALIEEVQSDWIREAQWAGQDALDSIVEGEIAMPRGWSDVGGDAMEVFRYAEHVLSHHRRMWDQATLAASLWLLRERLGIRTIFMHTFEGGRILKNIGGCAPPRSLYETLPRSFCFERVTAPPRFLRDQPGARSQEFWRLVV